MARPPVGTGRPDHPRLLPAVWLDPVARWRQAFPGRMEEPMIRKGLFALLLVAYMGALMYLVAIAHGVPADPAERLNALELNATGTERRLMEIERVQDPQADMISALVGIARAQNAAIEDLNRRVDLLTAVKRMGRKQALKFVREGWLGKKYQQVPQPGPASEESTIAVPKAVPGLRIPGLSVTCVRWHDAGGRLDWLKLEEYDPTVNTATSCGILVSEDDTYLILAQDLIDEKGNGWGSIPKCLIEARADWVPVLK